MLHVLSHVFIFGQVALFRGGRGVADFDVPGGGGGGVEYGGDEGDERGAVRLK
jgi:hypothetical protein